MIEIGVESVFEIDSIHRDIENLLTGMIIDENNKRVERKGSALINERGVILIMSIIKSHVNKNIYLSQVTSHFIDTKCVDIYTDLYISLIIDMELYEIKSREHVNMICEIVDSSIYASLKRAEGGVERTKYYGSMTTNYHVNDSNQQNQLPFGR